MTLKEIILFTNRNCVGFDENNKPVTDVHNAISYSHVDKGLAILVIDAAERCYISQFHEWKHEINKEVLKCLLGLRDDQYKQEGE